MKTLIQKHCISAHTDSDWREPKEAELPNSSKLLSLRHFIIGLACFYFQFSSPAAEELALADNGSALKAEHRNIWKAGVGEGFEPGTQTLDVSLAGGPGVAAFGSSQRHDIAWTSISYGRMVGSIRGEKC